MIRYLFAIFKLQFIFWFVCAALFLSAGCHSTKVISYSGVVYPSPPDPPRIQYLRSFSNSVDVTGKRKGIKKAVLGEEKLMPIGKPYGIATYKGKIYICDASTSGIEIIDMARNSFTNFNPSGRGQFRLPLNCFIDDEGMLYVTDGKRNEVVIFDSKLNFVKSIGRTDSIDDFRPMDVFVSDNKIWVTNSKDQRIHVYQKNDYRLLYSFPDTTSQKQRIIFNPINICVRNHKVYVTDFGDFKIKVFSEEGKLLNSIGEYGKALGQFVRPKGIAVDKENNLFVVDAGFENVQMFNEQGKLLMFFGGSYKGPGDMWLPAKVYIDYENMDYFKQFVSPEFQLDYLIFVSNQYGPDKISVYGAVKKNNTK